MNRTQIRNAKRRYAARYRDKVASSKQPNDSRGTGKYSEQGQSIRVVSFEQPNEVEEGRFMEEPLQSSRPAFEEFHLESLTVQPELEVGKEVPEKDSRSVKFRLGPQEPEWAKIADPDSQSEVPPIVFPPIPEGMASHLKPLYVNAHVCGKPITKVFIDNGAVFNVMSLKTLKKLGKGIHDLSPVDFEMTSFTGQPTRPEGMLVAFIEVGPKKIFSVFFVVDADTTYSILLGRDWIHASKCVPSTLHQQLMFWEGNQVFKMETNDNPFEASEQVEESVFYSAWDYSEMPGLERSLIEHRLPIKKDFKLCKQFPRRMSPDLMPQIKEEIQKLLKVGFIRPCRYADWLANIVPVVKKNGKIRICIDFRDLNMATPNDEYVMPMADMLINSAARHIILSLMDGYAGYNQIFLAEEDIHKTTFRCPGALGIYEWMVMPFGLKSAGATYQRSPSFKEHLEDLKDAFSRMKKYKLKMNPTKCAFGITAGSFLGFLVHERGIEINANKAKAILTSRPPQTVKEIQSLLGKVNYLRRFISNVAGKVRPITKLLKAGGSPFEWGPDQQMALEAIKQALT
ncbi:uncharacterized protein LOC127242396 [Andrographis paniculata]|uniref:uncharacterized protein LOC127242396 n=1 Tax=Andrographis paniculata TaxID=175694 RepID=UPI0021E7552C|nr:uncharacterized protein LOC127242396 [Andrographis paniculata]